MIFANILWIKELKIFFLIFYYQFSLQSGQVLINDMHTWCE